MLRRIVQNHVLANIVFVLVMAMGISSYLSMPRERDPTINFNWIIITTQFPGASTPDVEKQVTNVLEDAISRVSNIKFVSSHSRDAISSILVRFEDVATRTYDKRVADLRREIDGIKDDLPEAAQDTDIYEITTDNAFPSASVVVSSDSDDENLRRQAYQVKQDIEQLKGVSRALDTGLSDPEIHIVFDPERLESYGISPVDLSETIHVYFQNTSAGTVNISNSNWAVKITGSRYDLDYIHHIPVVTRQGEIALKEVAEVIQAKTPPQELVKYNGRPAVMFAITKQEKQNILELIERIEAYIDQKAGAFQRSGIDVDIVDDQTQITREALSVMQNNAGIGLIMVLVVAWIFMGTRIALLTGIAIPFILAGTFWFLSSIGQTLNITVLLGIVISLGMLVDDAIVVVEAIYYRLQRGADTVHAAFAGLIEVIAPVTTAVLTTIAAFLPLMLLPGILGKFMLVVPLVVSSALVISLIEAYWLLPAHIINAKVSFDQSSKIHSIREQFQRRMRIKYVKLLVTTLRHPILAIIVLMIAFTAAMSAFYFEKIKFDFFASDPVRLFYVDIHMPAGTDLDITLNKTVTVEQIVRKHIEDDESRAIVSYAGEMFTATEPLFGDQYGQILVSLKPKTRATRSVDELIQEMYDDISQVPGIAKFSFLRLDSGPPVTRDINIKVRGNNLDELDLATRELQTFMRSRKEFRDITDSNLPGQNSLNLAVNSAAVQRTGINPELIARTLRLLVDGEIISSLRYQGEKINIRLKASSNLNQISQLLEYRLPAREGVLVPLSELVTAEFGTSANTIRHYNYRRAITVEADIDKSITDAVKANRLISEYWSDAQERFPHIDLDFSGILDDIEDSLNSIGTLFLLGLGLIYLILGTQFKSYFQPFLIITTIPMAATGVVFGLLISQFPLSLYTLYGVVALAGIAVNGAIVLISAANTRRQNGMTVTYAIVFAARRRFIPIIITSLTTIAGLLSLAIGLGGKSLLWGPVASSMVWGLTVSTGLALFYIPLFYSIFMRPWMRRQYR